MSIKIPVRITAATIIGVSQLETTLYCISCKSSIPSVTHNSIIKCNSSTKQRARNLKTTAKIYVECHNGRLTSLHANQEILTDYFNPMTSLARGY